MRVRYGNTSFDYSLNYVWDLKAHTEEQVRPVSRLNTWASPDTLLNEEKAIRACVAEQGMGFLVLGGLAVMDEDQQFVTWHRAFKEAQGIRSARSDSGRSRLRKSAFIPRQVEAFWIPNTHAPNAALMAGQFAVRLQGRQAPKSDGGEGADRANKFVMHIPRAREGLRVAKRDWRVVRDS